MGLHKEVEQLPGELKTSFNEGVEIRFDELAHTYHYGDQRLFSATAFVENYISTFDSERVSERCADKWGVDKYDILALWDSNGDAASGFGTAMHYVMEHYFTYKQLGATIQDAAGKEKNAAMPNHPFLQQIITELELIRVDGVAHQEALVSCVDKGLCGLVDDLFIVDQKKKVCRIRDYKFTYDVLVEKETMATPFEYLGATKLAKYYVQLCFYGYLMQLSGWTVEGVDIYNWDGTWHHHTLDKKLVDKTMVLIASKYL